VNPYPENGFEEYEFLYGSAASALQRGADGVYLFNQNYRESGEPELLSHMLRHLGSSETVTDCRRRHAVTYPQANAPGGPIYNVLPIPLRLPKEGADFGRMEENITLRINTGQKPAQGRAVLCLGFGGISQDDCNTLEVRLNTNIVTGCEEPQYKSISKTFRRFPRHGWESDFIDVVRFFDLPLDLMSDGDNVFEFVPPQIDGQLEWAEVLIMPWHKFSL